MSRKWLRERSKDPWYKKAKREGYRSRASYKLLQIQERFDLVAPGDRVVDLGAAPGGWSQVAAELAGPEGAVVGIDLDAVEPFRDDEFVEPHAPVVFLRGDMRRPESLADVMRAAGGVADVVVSDMSPNISGQYTVDHARSVHLSEMALAAAERLLKRGGSFVCKVFEGEDFKPFLDEVRKRFRDVKVTSPPASRAASSEVYVVAQRFTGMVMPPPKPEWTEGTPVTDAPLRKRRRTEEG